MNTTVKREVHHVLDTFRNPKLQQEYDWNKTPSEKPECEKYSHYFAFSKSVNDSHFRGERDMTKNCSSPQECEILGASGMSISGEQYRTVVCLRGRPAPRNRFTQDIKVLKCRNEEGGIWYQLWISD